MFQNTMVDVAIGMIALFLLASLLVTALQEGLAQLLDLRARTLRAAIGKMLDGSAEGGPATKAFFDDPLIAALNTRSGSLGPSYIPRELFALVVRQVAEAQGIVQQATALAAALPPDGTPLQKALKSLGADIASAGEDAKDALASWFDAAMARASGLYKRKSQAIALILGFGVAVAGNLDAVSVANFLATTDSATRASIVGLVATISPKEKFEQHSAEERRELLNSLSKVANSKLPIGWSAPGEVGVNAASQRGLFGGLAMVLGWLITALATTLGAAFWFDLLNRVVNIRAAGPKPEARNS